MVGVIGFGARQWCLETLERRCLMEDEQARATLGNSNIHMVTDGDEPIDDTEEQSVAPVRYDITSFGIDFDVDGLYRRLQKGEIIVPRVATQLRLDTTRRLSLYRILDLRATSARYFPI